MSKASGWGAKGTRTETTAKGARESTHDSGQSFLDDPNSPESESLRRAIAPMMYGFGDNETPDPESVEFMRRLVVDYISDLTEDAFHIAKIKGRFDADCYKWLVRQPKDRRKFERIEELLRVKREVQDAKDIGKYMADR